MWEGKRRRQQILELYVCTSLCNTLQNEILSNYFSSFCINISTLKTVVQLERIPCVVLENISCRYNEAVVVVVVVDVVDVVEEDDWSTSSMWSDRGSESGSNLHNT